MRPMAIAAASKAYSKLPPTLHTGALSCSPIGCGVDVVEFARFRRSMRRWGAAFLSRIFTDTELTYANSRRDPVPHLAARFAAKEAIMKACSQVDPRLTVGFRQIEIRNDRIGRPRAVLELSVAPLVHISLSHDRTVAIANAIAIARRGSRRVAQDSRRVRASRRARR